MPGRRRSTSSASTSSIYPPGLLHAEHLELGRRQEIICFWVDTGPTPAFDHAIKLMDERGTLRELFEMVYAEFTSNRPYAAELISRYLQAIFLQARQHFTEPSREASSLVERCLGYIHENYALDFDIDDLAATVSVSPSYLFRLFKKKMQLTPMHYRNVVRIDKAKLLLADRSLTVDAVAERVGFDDPKTCALRSDRPRTPSRRRDRRAADRGAAARGEGSAQQSSHTAPFSGCGSGFRHAAHGGSKSVERS